MSNKKINLTYNDEKYCLEYSRETVKQIEKLGFSIDNYSEQLMTMIPLVFRGAFLKNHKFVKESVVNEIYDKTPNKKELMETLLEMIIECYNSLIDETEDGKEGNASWEIV